MIGLRDIGYPIEGYDAKDLQVNALVGNVGDLILFKYRNGEEWIYHAGTIRVKYPSGNMEVYECNFIPGVCDTRFVYEKDSAIRGYIHNSSW